MMYCDRPSCYVYRTYKETFLRFFFQDFNKNFFNNLLRYWEVTSHTKHKIFGQIEIN